MTPRARQTTPRAEDASPPTRDGVTHEATLAGVARTLQHYSARLDLWWAQRQHRNAENSAAKREASDMWREKVASGDINWKPGWYQDPKGPPGYQRWWDGSSWTEHNRQSQRAIKEARKRESQGLVIAGFVVFVLALFVWPLFLISFIIGIVMAAQGRTSDGVVLMVLSVIGPVLSIAGCAALLSAS